MPLKPSIYNYVVNYMGGKIIFNTYSGAIVFLDDEEYDGLNNNRLSEDSIDQLKRCRMLVDSEINELQDVIDQRYNHYIKSNSIKFKIFTTTACNAHCYYCFENKFDRHNMSMETAVKVAQFIIEKSKKYDVIEISWFGGEPLLNHDVITVVHNILNNSLELKGKYISSHILTNGSLFTEELVYEAKSIWNVRYVQITMDGMEENHNNIKQIHNMNAFIKTIDNIKLLLKNNIKVNVRINFNKNTVDDACNLIRYLGINFDHKLLSVYCASLFSDGSNEMIEDQDTGPYYDKIIVTMNRYGFIKNIKSLAMMRKIAGCSATNPNYITITTDGSLFRCPETSIFKEESIGSINTYCDDNKYISEIPKPCLDCILLPICQGGCVNSRRQLINNTLCHRYKYSMETAIPVLYECEIKKSQI